VEETTATNPDTPEIDFGLSGSEPEKFLNPCRKEVTMLIPDACNSMARDPP
jgi:hypothetical protein